MNQEEKHFELWELVGDRWRLPIEVRWEDGFAVIRLAEIPLLAAQRQVAIETLEPLKNTDGEFVAALEVLKKHARKSAFTNPEDIVEWRHAVAPSMHFKDPNVDAFLDAFVAKGSCPSRPAMSAIYSMLCAHMLQWLLQGKPLPLCFATIYPMLFRQNWRELVHHKFEKLKRRSNEDDLISRYGPGGISKQGERKPVKMAAWSLNLVHEKMFHDAAWSMENVFRVKNDYRMDQYWVSVRRRLREQLSYAKICYAEYRKAVRETSFAFLCSIKPSPKKSYRRHKHYREDGRLYTLEHLPFWRGKRAEQGKCGAVAKKNVGVSAMPGVQPEVADVRNVGEDVPK